MLRRLSSGLRTRVLRMLVPCVLVFAQLFSTIPVASPLLALSENEANPGATSVENPVEVSNEPPGTIPLPPDNFGLLPADPSTLEEPPAAPPLGKMPTPSVPGDLQLSTSDYLLALNQPFTLSVRIGADAASSNVSNLQAQLQLPATLTVLKSAGATSIDRGLQWSIATIDDSTPFVAEVIVQANAGSAGDVIKATVELSAVDYQSKVQSVLLGFPTPGQSVTVLLDPEASPNPIVASAVQVNKANATAPEVNPYADSVQESVNSPLNVDNTLAHVYLPLIIGGSEQWSARPVRKESGVNFYALWNIHSAQAANAGNEMASHAVLIFSAKELVAQGIDPHKLHVWARSDTDGSWETVASTYDETDQVFVVQSTNLMLQGALQPENGVSSANVYATDNWGLGGGLSTSGHILPSIKAFSSDRFTGYANFQLPVETPNGLGGLSPNLSLSYSSGAVDDLRNIGKGYHAQASWAGGLGWNLGGLSTISYSDGKYFLVLNGVSTELKYGEDSNLVGRWWSDPEMFFKIEHETPSRPINGYENYWNVGQWTITTNDGTRYYFGSNQFASNGEPSGAWTSLYWNSLHVCNNDTADCWKPFGYKWHLRRVEDRLGNAMDYSYEEEQGYVGGAGSACSEGSGMYDRATYLRQVTWSNGKMRVQLDRENRLDWKVDGYSEDKDCDQAMFTKQRLSAIKVQVLTKVNGVDNWNTIRKYTMDYGGTGTDGDVTLAGKSHSRLASLTIWGEHLDGQTPLSLQTYSFEYTGAGHSVLLTGANNSWGGSVSFEYNSATVLADRSSSTGEEPSEPNDCISGTRCLNRDAAWYSFTQVKAIVTKDGLGNSYRTEFQYGNMRANANKDKGFEYLGHEWSSSKSYLVRQGGTAVLEKEDTSWFIQRVPSDARLIDPRHGKPIASAVYAPNQNSCKKPDGSTESNRNNCYLSYQTHRAGTDTTSGDISGWEVVTMSDGQKWVREAWVTEVVNGFNIDGSQLRDPNYAANTKRFSYVAGIDKSTQFGNVIKVQEYDKAYNGDWNALTLMRSTETDYASNTNAWIVSLPARVRILDSAGNCKAESRTIYWDPDSTRTTFNNRDGNYKSIPWSSLPAKTEQALAACSIENDIGRYDANWSITRFDRDVYGNVTTNNLVGADANTSNTITTTYDSYYNLFPIAQGRSGHSASGYQEFGYYYGVNALRYNNSGATSTIDVDDSGAFWGAMAEYCAMNGVCSRQAYDDFGRVTNRWDSKVYKEYWNTSTANVHNDGKGRTDYFNDANTQWHYRDPRNNATDGFKFTSVTQWNNPRCEGNLKRSIYNGLGELVAEITPQQNWAFSYEGCNKTQNLAEVDHYYVYNSLGQVEKSSVPVVATGDWVSRINTIHWGNIWNTVAESRSTYDALGRVLNSYSPNGERLLYGYAGRAFSVAAIDLANNPDIVGGSTVANKVVQWQDKDALGNPSEIRSYKWLANSSTRLGDWSQDNKIALTHDVMGNLTKVQRTMNGSTTTLSTMSYDLGGRKTSMQDADLGGTMGDSNTGWRYTYNRKGLLLSQTDTRGWTTCLYYENIMFRLVGKKLQQNNTTCPATTSYDTSYVYDREYDYVFGGDYASTASRGQLGYVYKNSGSYLKAFYYNSQGQLISDFVQIPGAPGSYITNYGYDSYLRPITTNYPDGEVVTVSYNSMGLPNKLSSSLNSTTALVDNANYDEAGRLTAMRFPAGNNLWRTQSYYPWTGSNGDSNGRLSTIKLGTSNGSSDRLSLSYSYDSFSNIKSITEGGTTSSFVYDAQNRLTSAYGQSYAYDPAGRLTSFEGQSYTAWDGHAVTHIAGTSRYSYDANGNMTTRYTPAGNQSLTWDAENHLAAVSGAGVSESYSYDANGMRARKVSGNSATFYVNSLYEVSYEAPAAVVAAAEDANDAIGWFNPDLAGELDAELLQDENAIPSDLPAPTLQDEAAEQLFLPMVSSGNESSGNESSGNESSSNESSSNESGSTVGIDSAELYPPLWGEPLTAANPEEAEAQGIDLDEAAQIVLAPGELPEVADLETQAAEQRTGEVGAAALSNVVTVNNPGFQSGGWSEIFPSYYPGTSLLRSNWGTATGRKHTQDSSHYAYAISNQAYGYLQSDEIAVSAGSSYTLSAWIRGELDGEGSAGPWILRTYIYSPTGYLTYIDAASGTTLSSSWSEKSGKVTMPALASKVRLQLYFYMNTGWVNYDDVVFKNVSSASNPNLAPNPGFETTTGWSEIRSTEYPATSFFRSTYSVGAPHSGSYGYGISNIGYGYLQSDAIAVTANTSYNLSAWLRGEIDADDSVGSWIIRAQFYDSIDASIGYTDVAASSTIATSWQQYGGNFTTPAGTAKVRIRLFDNMNNGWVAFDDVSLLKNNTGSNLVVNPGFESTGNWSEQRSSSFPATSFLRSTWGTADGRSGSYGYVISNHAYGYIDSDYTTVSANTRYQASMYVRNELDPDDSGGCWTLRIQYFTSANADNGYKDVTNQCYFDPVRDIQWRQVGGVFTTPANTASVKFRLFSYMNSGWVAFDDVELHTAPVATKYYTFGGQRIAQRVDGVLQYLHSDHLGSTTLTTDANGNSMGSQTYRAYGSQRGGDGVPTENQFTGQKQDGSGLMYYGARFFDPQLGTFVSPDTIVPDPGNTFAYNRAMYSFGNPLKFVDPSGHSNEEAVHDSNDGPLPDWAKWHELSQEELDKAIMLWLYDHQNIGSIKAMMGLLESYYGQTNAVVPSSFGTVYAMAYSRAELPALWKGSGKSEAGFLAATILAGVAGGKDSLIHSGEIAGGCSFNAKTLVATIDGDKTIVSIQVGDKVLAFNQETGEIGYYTVTDTHAHLDRVVVYLTIDNETILTTPEHPFFTENGEWVGAGELRLGSRVQQIDGDLGTVRKVVVVEQLQLMYNLTVDQAHTFVVGDGQWLVHNADCLTYTATQKHAKGGWGTEMDLSSDVAQDVLNGGIMGPNGKQVYGYQNGKLYEFQPDNAGGYHGYPVPGNQVPSSVLRAMRDNGTISSAQYNRYVKGK